MVSLEAQEHGPDSNNGIEIFREVIDLESYAVYRQNKRQVIIQKISEGLILYVLEGTKFLSNRSIL